MQQIEFGELVTLFCVIVGTVAWFIRLEAAVKRNTERIADNEMALESGDNRMNTIDGKIGDTLALMYRELQMINNKFNETSNQVSRLEGMLQYKNNMEQR